MSSTPHLPGPIRAFDRVLTWIALVGGGVTLVFMAGLSFINVLIMRKALNAPIQGAEDLLLLSLVAIVALSIPFGGRTGAHIEIEVLESRMSKSFARWSMVLMKIIALGMISVMSWQLWEAGGSAVRFGETTQQLLISFEPFYYLLSIWLGIYAVVILLDLWQLIRHGEITKLRIGGDGL